MSDTNTAFRFSDKMNFDFHAPRPGRVELDASLSQIEQAELIRALLESEPAYLFKHALVQDTAYGSLMKQARKRLHRVVGETIERVYSARLDEYAALLARHFAEAGDDVKTLEYATRAGDAAVRVYAPAEARVHYAHAFEALARLPDNDENRRRRIDTLVKQVDVSRSAEEPARNLARLDEAESLAKQLSESDPSVQRQLARIYHWKGFVHLIRNHPDEALRYFDESGALARALGDDELEAATLVHAAAVLNLQGRFGEAEPLLRDSINRMRKGGIPIEALYPFAQLGLSLAHQGFYKEGLAEAQRGLTMALHANYTGGLETCYSILIQIYRLGNDIPRMWDASRAVVETAQAVQDITFVCSGLFSVAWAQSYLGQHQAAFENLARAQSILEMLGGQIPSREFYAAVEAEIAMNAGQVEEAQALAEQAVNLARSVESLSAEGLAQRVWAQALGSLNSGSVQEAEAHFVESLRLFEAGDARLEAAHTRVVWGKFLSERGDMVTAREHFEKATVQFEASGLTRELEKTRALLNEVTV
jgi:tetratricopeptide (TPR) repeat protein